MDAKVKAMIKLIEEDADSFARRAEMYYKKRPELMKLVEEFYRAYRALAERYDHATGELRHAHKTMAEAFPNQVPFALAEDSPSGSSTHETTELHMPELPHPIRALFDSNDSQKDRSYNEEPPSAINKKGLKHLHEMFGGGESFPRKSKFDEVSQLSNENQNLKDKVLSESERAGKAESEVQNLKKALNDIRAEKEAVLLRYQQSLEKLLSVEGELNDTQKDFNMLNEQAIKDETEVHNLKEALVKLKAEREAGFVELEERLERISILEDMVSQAQEDGTKAEIEAQSLKKEISKLEFEKEAGLLRYKQCLEKISNLENSIMVAEENVRQLNERADTAETEVKKLLEALVKLNDEKEVAALQYEHCMEKISKLENQIFCAQEEVKRLNNEVLVGATKLRSAEEKCVVLEMSNRSLRIEAENLVKKIASKDLELSEKHGELEKLQVCVQDEQTRYARVEATLETLQKLHSQSQEDQRALAMELKNGLHMLKDMEICKYGLEEELRRVKEENQSLNESNSSSTISIANLQDEILSLRKMKERLKEEVELQLGRSNALQQEIFLLKDEIKGLNRSYRSLMDQVELVGLSPESFGPSVKELQNENSILKQIFEKERDEKKSLSDKLETMDELLEKNAALQSSLSDVNGEKSGLVAEKATLLSQLQIITENMQKLLDKNTLLESSLSGANIELEGLRAKSKSLEGICQLLNDEKSNLLTERGTLVAQLENVEQRLLELEEKFTEFEEKYAGLEKERESTHSEVEELRVSLGVEKQERASLTLRSETRLATLETLINNLQEDSKWRRREFQEELDKAVISQFEIFILQKFIQDMEENNYSLLIELQKHIEASKLTDQLVSELESENLEQQVEAELLLVEIENLRLGIRQVFMALETSPSNGPKKKIENEQISVHRILDDIDDMKCCLLKYDDDRQQLLIENSVLLTLLKQLRLEGFEIVSEKKTLDRAYLELEEENTRIFEEHRSLLKQFSDLKEEKSSVEEENNAIVLETLSLGNLSTILKSFGSENALKFNLLLEKLHNLYGVNNELEKEVTILKSKLEMNEMENSVLKGSVDKLEVELRGARSFNDRLRMECEESKFVREKSEIQIIELSEDNMKQKKEIQCFREEIEESRIREENLSNEFELWEDEAATFYFDLQISAVREVLFEDKVHQLARAYEGLEDESALKTLEIEEMKERESFKESEIQGLKAQLLAYDPVIVSLKDDVASLEHNILSLTKVIAADNRKPKAAEVIDDPCEDESFRELMEDQNSLTPNGISDLQKLKMSIKAVEKVVLEGVNRLARHKESSNTNVKLEAAMREIEELKSQCNSGQLEVNNNIKLQKKKHEKSEPKIGVLMKDIPLDHVSDGSLYGVSKRGSGGPEDQMLELWETTSSELQKQPYEPTEDDDDIVYHQFDNAAPKIKNYSSELQLEKDLIVDKLEGPTVVHVGPSKQGRNQAKILQRLASDAQKLASLQVTVQNLRTKLESNKSFKKAKDFDFNTVKEQLEEVDEAVVQLFDLNVQLTKNMEVGPACSDGKTTPVRRKRVSDQARKGSEKIGRLQIELQKIQYVLLKFDDEKKSKGKSRFSRTKNRTTVILRDFIYSGRRASGRKKKGNLCGCFMPSSTNGNVNHI